MFILTVAGINFAVKNKYQYTYDMCRDYESYAEADYEIEVSDDEINSEKKDGITDVGYFESLAIYRKIAEKIILKNGFLLHGVAAEYKNSGIVFLAKSGVGKSTHAALWKELFPNDFIYVNGDKPLIRVIDNKIYAYGTPWAGKENLHSNMRTEIKKVCFISRAETNECVKLDKKEVFEPLIKQIYIPESTDNFLSLLSLINAFIQNSDFYLIRCNTRIDAAKVVCREIFQNE